MIPCDCYCALLRRSAQSLTTLYDEGLAPAGLSITQFNLLTRLDLLQKANGTQWAEAAGLERTTLVRNIKGLEKQGWLQRAEGSGKTYELSPAGKAILSEARPRWQAIQDKVAAILGPADAAALGRIQEKLERSLG